MPQPDLSPQDFVAKWGRASLRERQAVQEHFIDLCRLIGHPTPAEDDPTGERFTFEAGAAKTGGGQGWADVWKRGCFAWEYKGKDADLDKAYQQLLQYREALLNPPLLVVCDIDRLIVHTNFTNTVKRTVTLTLEDLLTRDGLAQLRAVFNQPDHFRAPQTAAQVTEQAAAQFARLAELLRKWGHDAHASAHFLIRLLFCLFAEDTGLLPDGLFTHLVERTRRDPAAFTRQLRQLFGEMQGGGWFGSDPIAHFNGGLFDDDALLELDSDGLDIVWRACGLDWAAIEPSILGTLFERSLDPGKRAQLGAHYTSREDILLIIEPVLMAPLRRRWQAVQAEARWLAGQRDAARGKQHQQQQDKLNAVLRHFGDEIAAVQVLDPACGSGNFLYLALKQLLDLQKAVRAFAGEVGAAPFFPSVSPRQLHGLEVNAYAHELAQATVQIGYIQWLRDNGFGVPREPILQPLHTIRQMDAILAYDDGGRPVEPDWPAADVIIGNPPFLGSRNMRAELGDRYVDDLRALYRERIPGQSDLVCYWFEKARAMIEAGKAKRAGLLATQGIRGGANRRVLERIKQTGDIFWAQSDRDWVLDGATVHVSMVGFDNGSETLRELDSTAVEHINSDLTAVLDLTLARALEENRRIAFSGTKKYGPFDIEESLAQEMLATGGNPNGRPNRDVVRPWMNGSDIAGRPRRMWIIDFGINMPLDQAAFYERPFEFVRRHAKPIRERDRDEITRTKWWLFQRPRPEMRMAIRSLGRYVATPSVSKHRVYVWVDREVVPDQQLYVFARSDDYFLGVLHSHIHEVWARSLGSQLRESESGQRYTATTTFETFPFPWPPGKEPAGDPRVPAIAAAARDLVAKRDAWLNPPGLGEAELKKRTLTNLYNQRPTWLQLLHRTLDVAVLDAYGWPHDLNDEAILARLLALNLERAAAR